MTFFCHPKNLTYSRLIKVVLPPPVHFWKYADVWPYKTYGGKPHTICMGETESRPIWPYLPYKIHADHPRGRREEVRPHRTPPAAQHPMGGVRGRVSSEMVGRGY